MPRSSLPRFPAARRAEFQLVAVCTAALAYGSLLPFEFVGQSAAGAFEECIDRALFDMRAPALSDLASNILLYIPLGFLWAGCLSRRRAPFAALPAAVAACLLTSLVFEAAQAWQGMRFCSGFDTAMNGIGGTVGAFAFMAVRAGMTVLGPPLSTAARQRDTLAQLGVLRLRGGASWWTGAAACYASWLLWVFLTPFELRSDAAAVRESLDLLFQLPFLELQKRSYMPALLMIFKKTLLFVPFGALLFFAVRGVQPAASWNKRTILLCAAFVLLFALAIELSQAFLASRYPASSDVVLYTAGAMCGLAAGLRAAAAAGKSRPITSRTA